MTPDIRPRVRFARHAALAAIALLAVVVTGVLLASAHGWTSAEMDFLRSVNVLHTAPLDQVALGINWLFGPPVASMLVLFGTIVVAGTTRRVLPAARFLVIVVVPWLGSEAVKLIVERARPDILSLAHPLVLEPGGLSFPSGHTTFAACLMIGIGVVAGRSRWRPLVIAAGAVVAVATAASRVYLGVHYPSDVVAALVYSVVAVTLVNAFWALLVVPNWEERRAAVGGTAPYRGATDVR
jgi:membrane-associated phospholipid phosphatase